MKLKIIFNSDFIVRYPRVPGQRALSHQCVMCEQLFPPHSNCPEFIELHDHPGDAQPPRRSPLTGILQIRCFPSPPLDRTASEIENRQRENSLNILVTGGAGYIGSITVAELVREGHSVTVVDNLSNGHRKAVVQGANLIVADIADSNRLSEIF